MVGTGLFKKRKSRKWSHSHISSDLASPMGHTAVARWSLPPSGSIEGDPFKAEVEALKLGLILMWDVNMRSAVCEVDCIELVQALVDERYQFHAMASDLLDIRLLLDRDWDVELMHISRDANEVADYLAGLGSGLQCTYTCLEAPPPQLCPILVMDLLAL